MSVKYCLPVPVLHFWPQLWCTLHRGLSARAEHLVIGTRYGDTLQCVKKLYQENCLIQSILFVAVLAYENVYLDNIPSAESYEQSYMHRDVISHVYVTKW